MNTAELHAADQRRVSVVTLDCKKQIVRDTSKILEGTLHCTCHSADGFNGPRNCKHCNYKKTVQKWGQPYYEQIVAEIHHNHRLEQEYHTMYKKIRVLKRVLMYEIIAHRQVKNRLEVNVEIIAAAARLSGMKRKSAWSDLSVQSGNTMSWIA